MPKKASRPINPAFAKLQEENEYKDVQSIAIATGLPHATVLAYATGRVIAGRMDTLEILAKAFKGMDALSLSKQLREGRKKLMDVTQPSERGAGMTSSNITPLFREWMKEAGIKNVTELSRKSGIKLNTLLNYTRGRHVNPTPPIILGLARALDMPTTDIIRRMAEEQINRKIALIAGSDRDRIFSDGSPARNLASGDRENNLTKNQG